MTLMELKTEHLPGEAEEILADGERKVKLVFATSHSIPKIGDFSLFQDPFSNAGGSSAENEESPMPELRIPNQAGMLFDTEPSEEILVSEYSESAGAEEGGSELSLDIVSISSDNVDEELYQLLEQLIAAKKDEQSEEPERYVFRCDGVMSVRDGAVVIRYEEDAAEGMENTQAEIVLHSGRRDMVSIVRTGSVANTLICEKGRRHISAYNTPVMPFQICVFAKECEQNVTMESGGAIYMDYYVELRGTEMQHTKMRITVKSE